MKVFVPRIAREPGIAVWIDVTRKGEPGDGKCVEAIEDLECLVVSLVIGEHDVNIDHGLCASMPDATERAIDDERVLVDLISELAREPLEKAYR